MAKVRPIAVFSLLFLWTIAPALACLPNSQMTEAEMACCKKMAGECHRGLGEHPCCKTGPSVDAPVATIQPTPQTHPEFAILNFSQSFESEAAAEGEVVQVHLGLPPPSPPRSISTLRI